jgi:hypothetical protein
MLLVLSASMFLPVTQSMPQMAEEMLPLSLAAAVPETCVPWPSPSDQFPVFLPEQSTPPVTLMS